MKTISVSVSTEDYEAFRRAAKAQHRPIAQLIREAMAYYRAKQLSERDRLEELPILIGHRPVRALPLRHDTYEDIFRRELTISVAAEGPPDDAPDTTHRTESSS